MTSARSALVGRLAGAAVALAIACALPATAGRSRTHVGTPADLLEGHLDGVAVTSDGRLHASPTLRRLSGGNGDVHAAQAWSIATDAVGTVVLGTGPDGDLVRVSAGGTETVLARLPDPLITAVLVLPDGSVLAGTSPSGIVYRVRPGGPAEPWCETGARYVWDLALGDDGRVYAATGEPGTVVRIADDGSTREWYASSSAHLVALEPTADGGMLVGSASRGILVRLDADGHALVVHDDDLPEIADVAVLPGGDLLAAVVGPPPALRRRPALRLALPGDRRFGGTGQVDTLAETEPTVVEGFIDGLDRGDRDETGAARGKILRIGEDGVVDELWRSTSEAPFSIAVDAGGRALFGTGEPARLYAVDGDDVALLATLDEGQVTRIAPFGASTVLAVSNPAGSYRVDWDHGEAGVFLSRVIDAGAPARWGTVRWWTDRLPSAVELFTRTGNTSVPDDSWSGWSPALTSPPGSRIVNPDGRFLQWRIRIPGGAARDTEIADVAITYEPYNRRPAVRGVAFAGGGTAAGDALDARWEARDPDGDRIVARIELRRGAADAWTEVARTTMTATGVAPDAWRDGSARAPVGQLEEGRWFVRIRIDDGPDNTPEETVTASTPERASILIDRTPPSAQIGERQGGRVTVTARDAVSTIREATVTIDGVPAYRARPTDGVCDGAAETFEVRLPADTDGRKLGLRIEDAAGNRIDLDLDP